LSSATGVVVDRNSCMAYRFGMCSSRYSSHAAQTSHTKNMHANERQQLMAWCNTPWQVMQGHGVKPFSPGCLPRPGPLPHASGCWSVAGEPTGPVCFG
jgi:hypothetical protein